MKNLRMIAAIAVVALSGQSGRVNGQTLTSLYSFDNNGGDGFIPLGGLVQGTNGNFYGTASVGGQAQTEAGTVFEITSSGTFIEPFKSSFGNGNNGAYPAAGLLQGSDGNYYGTTSRGGVKQHGHRVPYQSRTASSSRFCTHSTAVMGPIQWPGWCRGPMAISTAQLRAAA